LVGSADNAHVADIAGCFAVGDFVFGVQRGQWREQQGGEEREEGFHRRVFNFRVSNLRHL
jgi:hypothetical protein